MATPLHNRCGACQGALRSWDNGKTWYHQFDVGHPAEPVLTVAQALQDRAAAQGAVLDYDALIEAHNASKSDEHIPF